MLYERDTTSSLRIDRSHSIGAILLFYRRGKLNKQSLEILDNLKGKNQLIYLSHYYMNKTKVILYQQTSQ